ncbi:zinc-binding dehydrogenase [Rhodoglobus aureus]|uniref:Zinc-binding dehydrogenase n=1 Tax=Rhodoglobus aureus TaxID=191497 RepID=A0ABP4G847_9MICO
MITPTGRIAYMEAPRQLAYAEYPLPEPGPGALLVEVLRANVCGSELHIWNGKHPVKKRGGLGHEMVARIVAVGDGVTVDARGEAIGIGDRVVYTYFQTCQQCARCLDGQPNLCDNAYTFFGRQPEEAPHFHAAFATHYYVNPKQHVFKVPDSVGDAVAAGANCALSQVIFGLDQIELRYGETLLIQGAGGLGLNAIAVAKERGVRVIVVDAVPVRLQQALAFGADDVVDITAFPTPELRLERLLELTDGRGADVALEVTGVPAAFEEGLTLVRRGGRYLVMGNLSPGSTVPYDPGLMTRRAITVKHVDRYEARYLWQALEFLRDHSDTYPFENLVDAVFNLNQVELALEKSLNREVTRASIAISGME